MKKLKGFLRIALLLLFFACAFDGCEFRIGPRSNPFFTGIINGILH